jgi:repressor LexA
MIKPITKKQKEILDFVAEFIEAKQYSPSYREIGEGMGLSSPATVAEHVKNLEEKGFLKVADNEARSITLVGERSERKMERVGAVELPLVGLITAGQPIEAIEERETIEVPESMISKGGGSAGTTFEYRPNQFFTLKVKGESMIDEGINDGDYVVVEKKESAVDGEIVVALIEDQYATLKKFFREKDHVRLQPANSNMEPIRVKDVKVQGKVVGLIRRYNQRR